MARKRFTVESVFRGIDKISKVSRTMGRSISKFVRQSNKKIAKLGRSFKKLGSFMGKAIIGGAAVAAAAIGAAVIKTAKLGDEAAKTSRRLGITAEALQELRFAADRQGVSSKLLDSSFTALQKRVGELKAGTGSLFAFLQKTGDKAFIRQLSLAKDTGEAFELITKKAGTIKDPLKKAAFASAAFSRAGVDMLKMMEAGTDGITKLRGEARKYGAVISNEAAVRSEKFVDAMTNLKATLGGVGFAIGSKLIPILTPLIQRFADFWAQNRQIINTGIDRFISGVAGAFKFLARTGKKAFEIFEFLSPFLKPFIGTLLVFKGVLIAIAIVTKGWAIAQSILNAVMAVNPISLIIIAIAALVAGIVILIDNWDLVVATFKKGVDQIWSFLSGLLDNPFIATIGTIFLPFITVPALIIKHWEPIKAFFKSIWEGLTSGFNDAMKTITGIMKKIEDIPGVKSVLKFLGIGGKGEEKPEPKPVTPQERLSRSIEESTDRSIQETISENNSILTIKDQTGRGELSKQKRGSPKIVLATSGGA